MREQLSLPLLVMWVDSFTALNDRSIIKPLEFEEAVSDLLKVKPEDKRAKANTSNADIDDKVAS